MTHDLRLSRIIPELKHMAMTFPLNDDEQAWLNEAARVLEVVEKHRRIGEAVDLDVILEEKT